MSMLAIFIRMRTFTTADDHSLFAKRHFYHLNDELNWHICCNTFNMGNITVMETVETTFVLNYTKEQYANAKAYVENMKQNRKRVYWLGKEGKSDEELIIGHIAHKILSGFYNNYDPSFAKKQIVEMKNMKS